MPLNLDHVKKPVSPALCQHWPKTSGRRGNMIAFCSASLGQVPRPVDTSLFRVSCVGGSCVLYFFGRACAILDRFNVFVTSWQG